MRMRKEMRKKREYCDMRESIVNCVRMRKGQRERDIKRTIPT